MQLLQADRTALFASYDAAAAMPNYGTRAPIEALVVVVILTALAIAALCLPVKARRQVRRWWNVASNRARRAMSTASAPVVVFYERVRDAFVYRNMPPLSVLEQPGAVAATGKGGVAREVVEDSAAGARTRQSRTAVRKRMRKAAAIRTVQQSSGGATSDARSLGSSQAPAPQQTPPAPQQTRVTFSTATSASRGAHTVPRTASVFDMTRSCVDGSVERPETWLVFDPDIGTLVPLVDVQYHAEGTTPHIDEADATLPLLRAYDTAYRIPADVEAALLLDPALLAARLLEVNVDDLASVAEAAVSVAPDTDQCRGEASPSSLQGSAAQRPTLL